MPKQQTDNLVQLVRSLTKSEKRYFTVFVNRNHSEKSALFLKLFEVIDKQGLFDEKFILNKVPAIKRSQLSNLKAHLYRQLLICLRLMYRNETLDMEIREKIDFSRVLYNKGLYRQALDILNKVKLKSEKHHQNTLLLEILETEKFIESQYITRSIAGKADTLSAEIESTLLKLSRVHEFSNLSLQLYSLYLEQGYARNKEEFQWYKNFFDANMPMHPIEELTFYERLYLYQSYVWYYFIVQDFPYYYRSTQKWVDLFHEEEHMIFQEPALYVKGLHNVLNALFLMRGYERFIVNLGKLEQFLETHEHIIDRNLEGLVHLFLHIHKINKHYLEGTFTEGLDTISPLINILENNTYNWDEHRMMVFYYKIASLYFGSGDNGQAIFYLNKIINKKTTDYRHDIQCFSRILNLIAHFELGNDQLVDYQVKSVYRFLIKMDDLQEVQKEILRFIRKLPKIFPGELKVEFKKLYDDFKKLEEKPYERRPFLYLDIMSWLESKLSGKSVQEVIREKFLLRNKG